MHWESTLTILGFALFCPIGRPTPGRRSPRLQARVRKKYSSSVAPSPVEPARKEPDLAEIKARIENLQGMDSVKVQILDISDMISSLQHPSAWGGFPCLAPPRKHLLAS